MLLDIAFFSLLRLFQSLSKPNENSVSGRKNDANVENEEYIKQASTAVFDRKNSDYMREWRKNHSNYMSDWNRKHPGYMKVWKIKNIEKQRRYRRNWGRKNPNHIEDYAKEWNSRNKEKRRQYSKIWSKKHPNYMKEWRKKHPDYMKDYVKRLNVGSILKNEGVNFAGVSEPDKSFYGEIDEPMRTA